MGVRKRNVLKNVWISIFVLCACRNNVRAFIVVVTFQINGPLRQWQQHVCVQQKLFESVPSCPIASQRISVHERKNSKSDPDNVEEPKLSWLTRFQRNKNLVKVNDTTSTATDSTYQPVQQLSIIRRIVRFITKPFRYVKHRVISKRQKQLVNELDGNAIVSDETLSYNTTTLPLESSTTRTNLESSPQASVPQNQSPLHSLHPIQGERWAVAADHVDLSGKWYLINTDTFQHEYNRYLCLLGQPQIVRTIALSIVTMTTEETKQMDRGRILWIRGRNVRGVWERTLTTSGSDEANTHVAPLYVPIVTIDGEKVLSEAWWENKGTVHHSWIRGVTKYGGGDFEARRYLEQDGMGLVCETTFHPNNKKQEKARITWRFRTMRNTVL